LELEIKKTKPNGASTKLPPVQKPCEKMAEAIVMNGGKRRQVVEVCADPACRIHHPNTPSPLDWVFFPGPSRPTERLQHQPDTENPNVHPASTRADKVRMEAWRSVQHGI
jgi:hypothetical protein